MHSTFPNRLRVTRRGPLIAPACVRAFTLMEMLVVVVIIAALAVLVVSNMDRTRDDAESVAARATMQTIAEAFTGSAAGPGYIADMKYVPGFSAVSIRTHHLLFRPPDDAQIYQVATGRGWRGPYLRNAQGVSNLNAARNGAFPAADERRFSGDATFLERGFFPELENPYGLTDELAAADPWGNPIVVQVPPRAAFANSTGDAKRFRYARLVSAGADGVLTTPPDRLAGRVINEPPLVRGDDLVIFLNRSDTYENEES